MTERYEFIEAEKDATTDTGERKYTIVKMCEWLGWKVAGMGPRLPEPGWPPTWTELPPEIVQ